MTAFNCEVDVILERVSRIDCNACICFRPSFYRYRKDHDSKWYLNLGQVIQAYGVHLDCCYCGIVHGFSGSAPEEAVRNGWKQILQESKNPSAWFIRYYNCPPGKSIMQSEHLMWVRWNEYIQDWESPSSDMLKNIPENQVKIYHPGYPDRIY